MFCQGINKNGARCARRASEYCWQHKGQAQVAMAQHEDEPMQTISKEARFNIHFMRLMEYKAMYFESIDDVPDHLFEYKPHYACNHIGLITNQIVKFEHKQRFRNHIAQELIAEAMHPRRMMARISQFDDIESFFECC